MGIATFAEIARRYGREHPTEPAVHFGDRTILWAELDRRSNQVANALRANGVGPQQHVAFLDKNGPEFFELLYGAAKANVILVPVNWRLAPAEMTQIVNDAEAKLFVVGSDFLTHLEKMEEDLHTVEACFVLGQHPRHESYEAWLDAQPDSDPGLAGAPDDLAIQLYTSGTTGLPKGVMVSSDNAFVRLDDLCVHWGFRPESVNLVAMPLFHASGVIWALVGMVQGCPTVLLREADPGVILDSIARHRVTHVLLVPAVLQFMLDHPGLADADLSSLTTFVYGGSPISDRVLLAAQQALGCDFIQIYGLTESSRAILQLTAAEHDPVNRPDLLRSCGRPFPWVELRVVDPQTGEDVPPGVVGELWSRSAQTMRGYWNQPDATAATITPDGWLRSGDAGYRDAEGYVFLHDRVKDMIVSGGENIYPAEVENALMVHPDVADVAVIGVPDDRWGETVLAIAVPRPGAGLEAADLIAFARDRLAHYKCPTAVEFVDALPRNPSGKVLKRELREPYWADHLRRIS